MNCSERGFTNINAVCYLRLPSPNEMVPNNSHFLCVGYSPTLHSARSICLFSFIGFEKSISSLAWISIYVVFTQYFRV